jgi:4-amino-4-deoxy-L-arabinose transferase-like glycosyltransferase
MAYIFKNKTFLLLLLVLAIASFFRLWQLNTIPPGLYPDVAINGNDALDSLKTGDFKLFYPENNGREGIMMWLIAFSFSIFGASVWSIKIVAAFFGILTVLGTYLLAKELFNKNIALLSSFFLAVSFWHVNFSRFGFRAILLPFVSVFGFYFLFKGFSSQKKWLLILSGFFFGLGFYTYISYRMIVLLLPLIFFCWVYFKEKKQFLISVSIFLATVIIVALPIGIYFLQNPQDFIGRAAGVSIFSQTNPVTAFFISLGKHLAMFNLWGDQNWRHNFPGSPQLIWPVGILFLIGVILSFREIFKNRVPQKRDEGEDEDKVLIANKDRSLLMTLVFLLSWLLAMLLPGILTFEGVPHALRTIGAIPPAYIFAGLGGWKVYQFLSENTKKKRVLIFACFFFLFTVGLAGFNQYFVKWAQNPNTEGAFTKNFAEIGYYLNSLPENVQKYVIINEGGVPVPFPSGLPMPAQTPIFIERTKFGESRSIYLPPGDLNRINPAKETIIVPMKPDEKIFNELKLKFPQGEITEQSVDGGFILIFTFAHSE